VFDAWVSGVYICHALELDIRILSGNVRNPPDVLHLESEPDGIPDASLVGSVKAVLKVQRLAEGVVLEGTIQGTRKLQCSRTLEEFTDPFELPLQVRVQWNSGVDQWELDENGEEEYLFKVNPQADKLSLAECIRQQILLHEPLNPVKDPTAEFRWEEGTAEAKAEGIDPRWSKLKEWPGRRGANPEA